MKWLPENRNTRVLAICASVAVAMVGAAYASVPLYNLFCRVTGYGGTTQVAQYNDETRILDRTVEVRFDASRENGFPWTFEPVQRSMTVRLGETAIAYYRATNNSDRAITGTATYNVTPYKAAPFFSKLECFCFTEQTLQPGESIEMPVLFFVDAEMDAESRYDDVTTITLSYTFFESQAEVAGAAVGRDAAP
ncbi:cytochrome c oxidase assembly protein [Hyphobacterium marinum]|uniref:Cytochrome c oxidase assembly protein CtaG n=1 Tax=Hyphobacterium marinum TaxID=3116574 RepID=A0ABU7LYC4_9PROT|nr:cytochrome c oxidase assembly protein [Hyphobacterium sp. Y6023]MEE2566010.1 cytochrome c oxidase assembly protein [Hyphobacterium sp. Y6023]